MEAETQVHNYISKGLPLEIIDYNQSIHHLTIRMHPCFYLLFNIFLAAALFYTHYDPTREYMDLQGPHKVVCLSEDGLSKSFCAQCVIRDEGIPKGKGYLVNTEGKASILKIKNYSTQLSCKDYLQFPNFQIIKQFNTPLQIDNVKSIEEIMKEVGGVFTVQPTSKELVSSQFKQFVIYRWFEPTQQKQKGSKIQFPNPEQAKTLQHTFLYVANGIILLFITLYFYDKSTFSHLKPKILISSSMYFILIQALTLNLVSGENILVWIRILFSTILLMRIDTNKLMIAFSLAVGIAHIFLPILYVPYLLFVFLLLIVRGYNQQNTKQIWSYLLISALLYIANQVWWAYSFSELADTHCRLIELAFLVLTPIGLMLIKDAKYVGFDIYKPSDHKKHSISLSGFEEEEEDEETAV